MRVRPTAAWRWDMKAICLHARGGPEALAYEEAPQPHPGEGEVLVRGHAAGVIHTELSWVPTWTTRAGEPRPLPVIPGHEFSGEITALGAGVRDVGVGDQATDERIRAAYFIVEPSRTQLAEIARLIDGGTLRPVVGAVFPLAEARQAYQHKPVRGKVVLRVVDGGGATESGEARRTTDRPHQPWQQTGPA